MTIIEKKIAKAIFVVEIPLKVVWNFTKQNYYNRRCSCHQIDRSHIKKTTQKKTLYASFDLKRLQKLCSMTNCSRLFGYTQLKINKHAKYLHCFDSFAEDENFISEKMNGTIFRNCQRKKNYELYRFFSQFQRKAAPKSHIYTIFVYEFSDELLFWQIQVNIRLFSFQYFMLFYLCLFLLLNHTRRH